MSRLARQHRDLPAMMRIVRYQVSEKNGHIRAKPFNPPISSERRL